MYKIRRIFLQRNELLLVHNTKDVAKEACSVRFDDNNEAHLVIRPGVAGSIICEEDLSCTHFGDFL